MIHYLTLVAAWAGFYVGAVDLVHSAYNHSVKSFVDPYEDLLRWIISSCFLALWWYLIH